MHVADCKKLAEKPEGVFDKLKPPGQPGGFSFHKIPTPCTRGLFSLYIYLLLG